MAMNVMCTCVGVFFLISCGNGIQLSGGDGKYYHEASYFGHTFNEEVFVVPLEQGNIVSREKRYLAGEVDNVNLGDFSFASSTNQDSFQDPGGVSGTSLSGSTLLSNITVNKTIEHESFNNQSMSDHELPKTGGNYVSIQNSSETVQNNTSVSNGTTQSNITKPVGNDMAVTSTSLNNSISLSVKNNTTKNSSLPIHSTTEESHSNAAGDHITIANFPDEKLLTEHNITKSFQDSHVYYNSSFISSDEKLGKYFWVDMDSNPYSQTNDMLSQSHRRAATVKLSFDFPFYGHTVRNVTIATGGFLYTGDYVHSWLAATQYIAPLMANFDTSLSNESFVKYMDNGTQFTVQWDKVKLQDKPESGIFTFQATLKKTGDIIFVYQSVPVVISNITDDNHPVKVGLSDAYIIDRHVLFVRRKTIYEYHRIAFEHLSISNWTVINLIPLPTCVEGTDCESCLSRQVDFECIWCPDTKKCSNGVDRYRQEWLMNDCDRQSINNASMCPGKKSAAEIEKSRKSFPSQAELEVQTEHSVTALSVADESSSVNASALIGVLFCLGALLSLSLWVFYAYRNPHTTSGQFLIKYRPSQWSWRRGEARYTAATIHM